MTKEEEGEFLLVLRRIAYKPRDLVFDRGLFFESALNRYSSNAHAIRRLWQTAHFLGLHKYCDEDTFASFAEKYQAPSDCRPPPDDGKTRRRETNIDRRKALAVERCHRHLPNFWYRLRRKGVYLPLEPKTNFVETLVSLFETATLTSFAAAAAARIEASGLIQSGKAREAAPDGTRVLQLADLHYLRQHGQLEKRLQLDDDGYLSDPDRNFDLTPDSYYHPDAANNHLSATGDPDTHEQDDELAPQRPNKRRRTHKELNTPRTDTTPASDLDTSFLPSPEIARRDKATLSRTPQRHNDDTLIRSSPHSQVHTDRNSYFGSIFDADEPGVQRPSSPSPSLERSKVADLASSNAAVPVSSRSAHHALSTIAVSVSSQSAATTLPASTTATQSHNSTTTPSDNTSTTQSGNTVTTQPDSFWGNVAMVDYKSLPPEVRHLAAMYRDGFNGLSAWTATQSTVLALAKKQLDDARKSYSLVELQSTEQIRKDSGCKPGMGLNELIEAKKDALGVLGELEQLTKTQLAPLWEKLRAMPTVPDPDSPYKVQNDLAARLKKDLKDLQEIQDSLVESQKKLDEKALKLEKLEKEIEVVERLKRTPFQ
jgi:hypothetical protein